MAALCSALLTAPALGCKCDQSCLSYCAYYFPSDACVEKCQCPEYAAKQKYHIEMMAKQLTEPAATKETTVATTLVKPTGNVVAPIDSTTSKTGKEEVKVGQTGGSTEPTKDTTKPVNTGGQTPIKDDTKPTDTTSPTDGGKTGDESTKPDGGDTTGDGGKDDGKDEPVVDPAFEESR